MTLQEYINELNELVKTNPKALDLEVVYYDQTYDTCNRVQPGVVSIGLVEMQQFTALEYFKEYGIDPNHANCVCIN
jgi:hypothetical protein